MFFFFFFSKLILKFQNLKSHVLGNLFAHFLLLSIYRFVRTKQSVFEQLDRILMKCEKYDELFDKVDKLEEIKKDLEEQMSIKDEMLVSQMNDVNKLSGMYNELKTKFNYEKEKFSSELEMLKKQNVNNEEKKDINYKKLQKKI